MSKHNENKSAARKAITSLINLLKAESDIAGRDNPISIAKTEELKKIASDLQHQLSIYSYLEINSEAKESSDVKEIPEKKEQVIVPPPPAYIPAVQFEKIPVEIPIIKEPQPSKEIPTVPSKEIPTIIPPKNMPDIKSFIGFNEKLMFLRLFKSNIAEYEKAISQINSCSTREEANTIIDVLGSVHQWDKESEPVQIFQSIVKRRFS